MPKQSTGTFASLTLKQIIQSVSPSIVRLTVIGQDGKPFALGSGLVVGPDTIATNLHVVAGAHAVTANFPTGRSETVIGLIGIDSEHDLVLLRANTQGVRSLPLEEKIQAEVGDPVVAIGSPEGFSGSVSTGIVSALRMRNGTKLIQTTAPISHGSSGGGLISMRGQVIGVTSLSYSDGQNINFAYPAFFLSRMMKQSGRRVLTWKQVEAATPKVAVLPKSKKLLPGGPVPPDTQAPRASAPTDIPPLPGETAKPSPPPTTLNYSPISSQDAGPMGDFAQVDLPSGVDVRTLISTSVAVAYDVDEDGHPIHIRVSKSSGNADFDDACKDAIRRTRFKPAIKDHLKRTTPCEYTFTIG